jgi:hypothetical protein
MGQSPVWRIRGPSREGIRRTRARSYRVQVQRLFSLFPDRWAGFALLVLRNALAAMLLAVSLKDAADPRPHAIAACIAAALLCPGLLTPMVSAIAAALWLVDLRMVGALLLPFHVFCAVVAAVLAVLGPGAYSIDARLFGRRVLILPPDRSK